ncbi:hypothetical protein V8C44DRAFT_340205 [Trichoderma aethiopicum]
MQSADTADSSQAETLQTRPGARQNREIGGHAVGSWCMHPAGPPLASNALFRLAPPFTVCVVSPSQLGSYPPSPPQESLDLPNPRVGAAPALRLPPSEAPLRGPLWIFSIFSIRQRRRRDATPPTPNSWRADRDRCDDSSLTTRVLLRICVNPIVSRSLALFSFLLSRLGMSR